MTISKQSRARALAASCMLVLAAAWAVAEEARDAAPRPSLYHRMGGYEFVARFVDTAFPRVAQHPQLRRLFQGHSVDSQIRQRQLVVDAFCQATGGPCTYVGRPMKPVHTGLGITGADWKAFTDVVAAALEEIEAPPAERAEFLGLLESRFRPDVVERP